jgi:Glyoxalase-like domain
VKRNWRLPAVREVTHLTVTDDVDAKFQRALDAGATAVAPLQDQFWGDRYGVLADPFGHHWSLGQPVREVSIDEIQQAMGGLIGRRCRHVLSGELGQRCAGRNFGFPVWRAWRGVCRV